MRDERPTVMVLSTAEGFRGGERQAAVLLNALPSRGFRAVAAAPPGAPLFGYLSPQVEKAALRKRSEISPFNRRELAALCSLFAVDILHCNDAHALGRAAWLAGLRNRPSVVAHRRMALPIRSRLKYARVPDAVIAISRTAARALEESGIPPSRIRVVYSAVDPFFLSVPPDKAEARKILRLPEGSPVLLYAAAFTQEKGHELLFDAFRIVLNAFPEALLVLAGSGPLEEALRAAAPLRVHFAGTLEREDMRAAYAAADLFVFAGEREGLGTAALEAMACGVPVAAVNRGGVAETVEHGVTGLLAEPTPAHLAEAAVQIISRPEARRKMGEAARARVERLFSPEAMIEGIVSIYQEILGGAQRRGGAV